jgi:uracil-DNA glycosylase family 4
LARLAEELGACRACPRLSRWREQAVERAPARFAGQAYWAAPVAGFGDLRAALVILGLAPGAHGANRTGRPFTGDGAGELLYGALWRAGLASAERSTSRADGLQLCGVWITNVARCAPPGNRPSPAEIRRCRPFLERELGELLQPAAMLCLGQVAWRAALDLLEAQGRPLPRPRPPFAHGTELALGAGAPVLVGCYHPSQLNTRTGRLTPAMFDQALARARRLAGIARGPNKHGKDEAPSTSRRPTRS